MEDVCHFGTRRQPMRDIERRSLMCFQSNRHRPQPPCSEIGIVGRQHLPKCLRGGAQCLPVSLGGGDCPSHHIAVADDIFGRSQDRHIDALIERGEEIRCRPGVIEQGNDLPRALMPLCRSTDGWNVRYLKSQASRAFHQDGSGAIAE